MADNQKQTERPEEAATTQSTVEAGETCPECDGRTVADAETAETVCTECGLVVDEERIDTGPEWRAFDAEERDAKSRVGGPTTPLLHDKGLSTTIGWRNKDAKGNAVPSPKRKKLSRLRTWNQRFRTRDSAERNLKQALGEINRMASALGVPAPTRETASVIYRQALDNDLLPGRSIEGVATASLYAASRLEGIPRSVDEVAAVSRIDDTEIKRTYRYITRELDLAVPPTSPMAYIGRFASKLDCPDETEHRARELVENAMAEGVHSGRDPVSIAASALYAAGQLTNRQMTQSSVSEVSNVSEVTIRSRYPEVLAAAEEAG